MIKYNAMSAEGLAEVSRNADELGMIDSMEIGSKKVRINMFQYADDTFFAKRIQKVYSISRQC